MKYVYLILASLLLPIYSEAVPVKFSECTKTTKVNEPKNSSGFFFDDSCQVAYVLPPQSGSLEIYGLSPTGDLESACQSYSNIMKSEESYSKSILILAQSIEDSNEQISKYNEYLSKGLFPVGMTEADLQSKIQNLLSLALDYQNKYAELIEGLRNLKKYYATDEGATGKFYLESQYSSLIAEFQKKNPKIQFVRIPLEQSYISINEKSYSPENASMSAVLSLQADTIGTLPVIKGFNETEAAELLPAEVLPGGIFTDSMGGDIAFSVIGACAFLKKNGTLPEKVSPDKISTYINAKNIYQYHEQMHRKHKITYNLAQLAKRIESSSQKGGFFSRKSVHSLTEKTESKKWIHFEAYSDDPHYTYTDKYTQEIKEQFLNSVLQEVAYVSFDNPGKYPSVVLPEGQTGAGVAGEALGKCPHLYCTVASYAMKFLDTTFGKKSAISEFIRTRDVDVSESLDEKQMVPYVGSYTFK